MCSIDINCHQSSTQSQLSYHGGTFNQDHLRHLYWVKIRKMKCWHCTDEKIGEDPACKCFYCGKPIRAICDSGASLSKDFVPGEGSRSYKVVSLCKATQSHDENIPVDDKQVGEEDSSLKSSILLPALPNTQAVFENGEHHSPLRLLNLTFHHIVKADCFLVPGAARLISQQPIGRPLHKCISVATVNKKKPKKRKNIHRYWEGERSHPKVKHGSIYR